MHTFDPQTPIGPLEDWPFDAPESAYEIIEGAPRASGRYIQGGPGHQTRTGIWRCTKGVFSCIEQGDELMTVLSGSGTLTNATTGEVVTLIPGRSVFVRDGMRAVWRIDEDLTKVFHAYKRTGY
jgi:uncharacterized cupin superfamily protein